MVAQPPEQCDSKAASNAATIAARAWIPVGEIPFERATLLCHRKFVAMSDFSTHYDQTIDHLDSRLSELVDEGLPFEFDRMGDVLTIEFEDGEKFVITPQAPLEQLWLSARAAGHRFLWNGSAWEHERNRVAFLTFLQDLLSEKLAASIVL